MIKSTFTIVLGILLAFLCAEAAVRVTDPTDYDRFQNDTASGLIHYKENYTFTNSQSCYTTTVHTNTQGLHAPEPPSVAKKPDEFRIVVAGSSFAEGLQVPLKQTVSADLQDLLNSQPDKKYTYEVIPVAFSGNGTFLDILYYLRYGEPLKPNLVIDITTEYEYTHDGPEVSHFNPQGNLIDSLPPIQKDSRTLWLKDMLRQSKLVMNLNNRILIIKDYLEAPAADTNTAVASNEAKQWSNEEELLGAFAKVTASSSAPLVVASWPSHLTSTSTLLALSSHLANAASKSNFYYLDMLPSISGQEAESGISASWSCDAHWDAAGDRYAANALFAYLQAHPTLIGQ